MTIEIIIITIKIIILVIIVSRCSVFVNIRFDFIENVIKLFCILDRIIISLYIINSIGIKRIGMRSGGIDVILDTVIF
jgi:hypothetical protein